MNTLEFLPESDAPIGQAVLVRWGCNCVGVYGYAVAIKTRKGKWVIAYTDDQRLDDDGFCVFDYALLPQV